MSKCVIKNYIEALNVYEIPEKHKNPLGITKAALNKKNLISQTSIRKWNKKKYHFQADEK